MPEHVPASPPPSLAPYRCPPVTTVPDESTQAQSRTRKASRTTRAASGSVRSSVAPTPAPEAAIESEKENKKDPPRRKARDTQKRLGVGKPRIAGGTGPRSVTRIVPSRSATTRTRSRVDIVEGDRMAAVVEEEDGKETRRTSPDTLAHPVTLDSSNGVSTIPTSSAPSPPEDSQMETGASHASAVALTRRITTIESQITQLYNTRDTLLIKLSAQEKDIISIKDDLITERSKILSDVTKTLDTRIAQQQTPENASQHSQLAETQRLLDVERERVAKLEAQMDTLVQRLTALEDRLLAGTGPVAPDQSMDSNALGIDPAAFLNISSSSHDDFSTLLGKKRAASTELEAARAPKRVRQDFTPGTLIEQAFVQANAASSSSTPPILPAIPADATPRTPPLTRNARRQLQLPPASPRGGAPSSQLRKLPASAASPTTDSPRKGLVKGKGKETATALPFTSPSKAVKSGSSKIAPPSNSVPPAASSASEKPSANLLELMDPSSVNGPGGSPAFPVYQPPSRFNRGLGLGLPSAGTRAHHSTSTSSSDVPLGLLPPYPYGSYPSPRRHSNNSTDTDSGPGLDADADMHEPTTPLGGGEWGISADDGPPPSPDKRTLYGTEVIPEQDRLRNKSGTIASASSRGRFGEDEWL